MELKLNNQQYVLNHYPIASWNRAYKGAIHLHGHVHSGLNNNTFKLIPENQSFKHYDVGIDNNNLSPISAKTLLETLCN
jgi:calcineurin-like phosphoesterase family protein